MTKNIFYAIVLTVKFCTWRLYDIFCFMSTQMTLIKRRLTQIKNLCQSVQSASSVCSKFARARYNLKIDMPMIRSPGM